MSFVRAAALATLSLLALVLLSQGATPNASAAVFAVDSSADWTDANPGDGVCATSTGACTLRAAIQETNALPGDDTITLPAGAYNLTIEGIHENDSASGDLDIRDDLTLTGSGAATTILNGSGIDRVIEVHGRTLFVEDVTVRGGYAPGPNAEGGGINAHGSVLTIVRTRIVFNRAQGYGGGLAGLDDFSYGESRVTIIDSLVSHNTVDEDLGIREGGGLYTRRSDATVTRSTFTGNSAKRGGAMYLDGGTGTVSESTISGNNATQDGAGIIGSQVSITSSTIAGNTSVASPSGLSGGAGITVTNTVLAANSPANCSTDPDSLGHNISSDDSCGLTEAGDVESVDPMIGPLQDNGGITPTHYLMQGSPAIDAGDAAACATQDQRGQPRPVDGNGDSTATCDIGAIEVECVAAQDGDCDSVGDSSDNCPSVPNAGQENLVHPASPTGDACEDADTDSIVDSSDNCPDDGNMTQEDHDGDAIGDPCDGDADADGLADSADACPLTALEQPLDGNGCSDAQVDRDGDTICNPGAPSGGPSGCTGSDNCPWIPNAPQADGDGDGTGDVCELGDPTLTSADADGDGVRDDFEGGLKFCDFTNDDQLDDQLTNDGCPAVGQPEGNCINTLDDDLDGYLNDGCPAAGSHPEGGFFIHTDHLVRCGEGAEAGPSGAWPLDLVSGGGVLESTDRINVLDLTSFLAPMNRMNSSPGDPEFDSRWDLVPGITFPFATFIAVNDLTQLLVGPASKPPMFGGEKVFNGPVCTDP